MCLGLACCAGSCCCSLARCCTCRGEFASNSTSKLIYVAVMAAGAILAALLRFGFGQELESQFYSFKVDCVDDSCVGIIAVYRISLALFVFFALMTILVAVTPVAHVGGWMLKLVGFVILLGASFFVPADSLRNFSQFARIGSILFLFVQVLVMIDFAFDAHEYLTRKMAEFVQQWQNQQSGFSDEKSYPGVCQNPWAVTYIVATVAASLGSIIAIILLWVPGIGFPQCGVTNFFLGETLLFGLGFAFVSMLEQVNQGALPPAILWVNSVFLAYGAISNNPDKQCNPLAGDTQWGTILLSLIFAAVALVWMAFRAASSGYDILCPGSYSTLVPEKNAETDELRREAAEDAMVARESGGLGVGAGAGKVKEWGAADDAEAPSATPGVGPAAAPAAGTGVGAGLEERGSANPAVSPGAYGTTGRHGGALGGHPNSEEIQQQEEAALASVEGQPWVFHLIMAAGGLYLAMALTNWGYATQEGKQAVAVEASEIAMWVRVACQFAIHAIYTWILVAPACFPDRDFGAREEF